MWVEERIDDAVEFRAETVPKTRDASIEVYRLTVTLTFTTVIHPESLILDMASAKIATLLIRVSSCENLANK